MTRSVPDSQVYLACILSSSGSVTALCNVYLYFYRVVMWLCHAGPLCCRTKRYFVLRAVMMRC